MMFWGWTQAQFAEAVVRYRKVTGLRPDASSHSMIEIQYWWEERHLQKPGEIVIEGLEPEMDLAWASRAFLAVIEERSNFVPVSEYEGKGYTLADLQTGGHYENGRFVRIEPI